MIFELNSITALFPEEIRLSPAAACRAWSEAHGCWSALQWNHELTELPAYRHFFEALRLRIAEVLDVEGIDRLGLFRKLIIHETTASFSRQWVREAGFVHVEAASGIHLYCLWDSYERLLEKVTNRFHFSLPLTRFFRTVPPLVIGFFFWGLVGFRPGMLRPLILVLMRWISARFGIRWRSGVPLLFAIGTDAAFGFFRAYGGEFTFTSWAPGELHYLLSWWGGILGYEWAKERKLGSLRAHLSLSFFSWLAVLPLDLFGGAFAPWTPVLSFLTIEFFTRGGFLLFFVSAFLVGCEWGNLEMLREALSWVSVLWNFGIGKIAEWVSRSGGVRSVSEEMALFSAIAFICVLTLFALGKFRHSDEKLAKDRT